MQALDDIDTGRSPENVRHGEDRGGGEQVLELEQWLPCQREHLFPFFADPYNLEAITPPFLHFQVLRFAPGVVRRDTVIDYRLRLHGVPISWRTRIDEWDPPRRFIDRQIFGPYALWHHTHEFAAHGDGTVVRDRVRYRLPLGWLGALLGGRWVRRDLERIFLYRRERMARLFAASRGDTYAAG